MRKVELWLGSLLWAAVALLMPMAALEPVAGASPTAAVLALGACDDGSAHLAMGCASIQL